MNIKEKNSQQRSAEAELLLRLQQGDEEAFASLFYAYKDKLFGFAMVLTNSSVKAEDLVQDVFLKIWQNRANITDIENINAFMFRMAQNQAIDELRRFSKETLAHSSDFINEEALNPNPAESLLNKEIREKIKEAVDQLPPQQKRIYILHNEDGYKYEEIASELNLSVSTIRNHMSQALGNIRKLLSYSYPENIFIYWAFFIGFSLF